MVTNKRKMLTGLVIALVIGLTFAGGASAATVYEGFDYATGPVSGKGSATDGWNGAWTGTSSQAIASGSGLSSAAALTPSGGATQRTSRSGNDAINREISAASQGALTADGSTTWFSVLMNPGSNADGYASNSFGTLIFGDAQLTGGDGSEAAPIATGGNAIGVGFASGGATIHQWDVVQIQGVTYDNGTLTENTANRITVGDNTVMIVGEMIWNANGTDDIIKLHNVSSATEPLPSPFSTMTADLDQSAFNVVGIGDAQTAIFDEIRFGEQLADVAVIPEPASFAMMLAVMTGVWLLRRRIR